MKKTEVRSKTEQFVTVQTHRDQSKKTWQKPKLEDVSGKVMAQPYIRFT